MESHAGLESLLLRPEWVFAVAEEVERFLRSLRDTVVDSSTLERFFTALPLAKHEFEQKLLLDLRSALTSLSHRKEEDRSADRSTKQVARGCAERARTLLIDEHCKAWTLTALARAVGCNRTTLQEEFRILTGTTVHKFLVQHRVAVAQRLLTESDLKISRVPLEVGYRSRSAFARHFRNVTGLTPTTYRVERPR